MNYYSDKYLSKNRKEVYNRQKVSIPLSAEIQAKAEEITNEFNHVFVHQKNKGIRSRAESTTKPAPMFLKTAEDESRNSQNSPSTPMRLSTNVPPIKIGSVLGTTIVRTKSSMMEDNSEKPNIS